MSCQSTVNIRDPVNKDLKKYIAVPCGKCVGCLMDRREQWVIRMGEELKTSVGSFFITLTFSEEKVPITPDGALTLDKKIFQDFMKRFRKQFTEKLKFYAVGEYGTNTSRPHYHFILFNCGLDKRKVSKAVDNAWKSGFYRVDDTTPQSLSYVAKYIVNTFNQKYDGVQKPFSLMSKGIGSGYITKAIGYHTDPLEIKNYMVVDGYRKKLPRYYAQKMFSEDHKKIIKNNLTAYHEKDNAPSSEEALRVWTNKQSNKLRFELDRKEAIRNRVIKINKSKSKI